MTWVTVVFDNFLGLPLTVNRSWMAGSLAPVMYWAVRTTRWSALWSEAEQLPYKLFDATSQDALNGATVELFEDLGTHAKSFQSPEREKASVLVCLDHNRLLVMWTPRNLKLSTRSSTAPSVLWGPGRPAFFCSP